MIQAALQPGKRRVQVRFEGVHYISKKDVMLWQKKKKIDAKEARHLEE